MTIERDEDGIWVAECQMTPGCVTQGSSEEEALANIEYAMRQCLEVRLELGLSLTIRR